MFITNSIRSFTLKTSPHLNAFGCTAGNVLSSHEVVKQYYRDFPDGPGVKTLSSNAGHMGLTPCQGAKILHASWPEKQIIKQKQYYNKSSKDF